MSLSGCNEAARPASPAPAPAPAVTPPAAADGPKAAPDPSPAIAPEDPPILLPDEPRPAPATGEFRLAAYRDGALAVFSASNGVTLVVGAQAIAEAGSGEQLSRRPGMTRGFLDPGVLFHERWHTGTVGGRWPDSTWISAFFEGNRSVSPFYVYYRKGDRWQRKANIQGVLQWYYAGFAPWTAGQTLALRVFQIDPRLTDRLLAGEDGLSNAWERRFERELRAASSQFAVIDPAPDAAPPPRFPPGVTARAFTAHTDGQIYAIVGDPGSMEAEPGPPEMLRWAPGATEPQRFPLPAKDGRLPALYVSLSVTSHPDGSLWVGSDLDGSAYVARFDGRTWDLRSPPATAEVRSLSAGPDGVLWAVTAKDRWIFSDGGKDAGTLWRSDDGRRWREVALPTLQFADMAAAQWEFVPDETQGYVSLYGDPALAQQARSVTPYQVYAAADDVWVVGITDVTFDDQGQRKRDVVLRRRPVVAPLAMPSDNALRLELLDERPNKGSAFIGEAGCDGALSTVLFMSLPVDAPTTGPVPQVEQFLTSYPERVVDIEDIWEARHHGKRVAAFMVRVPDRSDAAAMLAAMQAVVPEKRTFLCTQPIVVRPLHTRAEMEAAALAYTTAHPPK